MKEKKQSDVSVLMGYAGSYKGLTFLGLGLAARQRTRPKGGFRTAFLGRYERHRIIPRYVPAFLERGHAHISKTRMWIFDKVT